LSIPLGARRFRASQPIGARRLGHFTKITDERELRLALLASASIPVFFPPVEMANDWYVDGGTGNHTPTREAAYFLRYLEKTKLGTPGEVYCITQDPPGAPFAHKLKFSSSEILKRTLEIYHFVHTDPIVRAWSRIVFKDRGKIVVAEYDQLVNQSPFTKL
jgi:hypothetical protein